MKKKPLTEEQKKEKQLLKLSKDYDFVVADYNIDVTLPVEEQVHRMVDAASDLQTEICQCSDKIKYDDFDKVSQISEGIDKSTYLDFVRISSLKAVDKLQEKAISKFESDFEKRLLITNLRKSFLESYMNGEDLKITDDDGYKYEQFDDYTSEDFEKILEDSANTRIHINLVLCRNYKRISNAAVYITKGELTNKDFKNLVDWQHYAEGGYPSPSSPSRIWKIFKEYNYALRLLDKYQYQHTIKPLHHEFGLDVTLREEHEVSHPWNKEID